jgi:serine/threonine-protein kinase
MSNERVDSLLDELLDRMLRGESVDLEQLLSEHPELDHEERSRLRTRARAVAAPTQSDAPPFERLGEFRLLRKLGAGGMGVVYLADQTSLGRRVALKVMRPELAGSEDALQRFQREAAAIAQLRHRGIVAVHAAGEDRGVRYLAMEYLPGASLDELLRGAAERGETIPPARAARWGLEIARALESAHAAGVVHRDVKPSNVRIGEDGSARLVDFGLARLADLGQVSVSGAFQGTPYFASPEQVEGRSREIDGRTDVYSLGATLYHALTGAPPFVGDSSAAVFHAILTRDPVPPRRLQPAISKDLETVVLKAMEKDRERRYAGARELADDLEALLAMKPIRARPLGPVGRAAKWARRQPALAAAALVIAALAIGGAIALPVQRASARRAAALEALARGEASASAAAAARRELAGLRADEEALGRSVPPGQPPSDPGKQELFRARDRLSARAREREELIVRADREFAAARSLAALPEIERAQHDFFARLYVEAEEDRDELALVRLASRLRGTAREDVLEARGTLALDSEPSGARATAYRYVSAPGGRLVEDLEHPRELGTTPVAGAVLEAGAWLVVLRADGRRDTRYPLRIERDRAWRTQDDRPIPLFLDEELGEDFVYVPAGWTVLGPDRVNPSAWPRRVAWLEGFLIGRFEVTRGEYAEFLEASGADQHVPRELDGRPLWSRDASGRWRWAASALLAEEERPRMPVGSISWRDAAAFAAWRAQRDGRPIRLPTEPEWEHAARGADGREFPWGEAFDPGFCASPGAMVARYGPEGRGWLPPVGTFELDRSPFGVCDLSGSVFEWTATRYSETDEAEDALRVMRGGSAGHSAEHVFRLTSRMAQDPGWLVETLGFRLACDLPRR